MAISETKPGIIPVLPDYNPLWDPPVIPDRTYDPFTTPVIPPDLPKTDTPPSRWIFPDQPEEVPDVA